MNERSLEITFTLASGVYKVQKAINSHPNKGDFILL